MSSVSRPGFWLLFGLVAQAAFFGRFLIQWIASERRGESVVPEAFWHLSVVGGVMLLAYAIHRRDAVFILGQATGLVVYVRNLMMISKRRSSATPLSECRP